MPGVLRSVKAVASPAKPAPAIPTVLGFLVELREAEQTGDCERDAGQGVVFLRLTLLRKGCGGVVCGIKVNGKCIAGDGEWADDRGLRSWSHAHMTALVVELYLPV